VTHYERIQERLREREDWIFRRQKGIPNNRRLFVLACMDERVPVEQVLEIEPGDAHVFRNAGGLATGDAIRSAALTIHFFQTAEIIIVNHTECGMLTATGEQVTQAIEEKTGLDLTQVALDPGLPDFRLSREDVHRWWKTQTDIDQASVEQAEAFRRHPLIPDEIPVTSYVYEVETGNLREPGRIYAAKTGVALAKR